MVWMGSSTPGNSLKGRGDDSWARDHFSICIVLGSSMPGRSLKERRDEGPW